MGKLNCIGGAEYAGNLSNNPKETEKKRKAPQAKLTPEQLAAKKARQEIEGENPANTPKVKLNSLCMKIVKRYLQKGETTYECNKVAGGYQGTVKLSCLPGDWGGRVWAGHVCATKAKAEQSAAEIAMAQINGDAELVEEASKPKPKSGGNGKGGGKGGKGK